MTEIKFHRLISWLQSLWYGFYRVFNHAILFLMHIVHHFTKIPQILCSINSLVVLTAGWAGARQGGARAGRLPHLRHLPLHSRQVGETDADCDGAEPRATCWDGRLLGTLGRPAGMAAHSLRGQTIHGTQVRVWGNQLKKKYVLMTFLWLQSGL